MGVRAAEMLLSMIGGQTVTESVRAAAQDPDEKNDQSEEYMMKKILVAGSSNIDFVLRVNRDARKGETVRAKSFSKVPGGKGANQACAAASWAATAHF